MSKKKVLLLESSDDDSDRPSAGKLHINRDYAMGYQEKKEKQELAALKEKYEDRALSAEEPTDSESEEDEDENGELLTPQVDAKILDTLATIKAKDPKIYSRDVEFFGNDKGASSSAEEEQVDKRTKKLSLKEYQNRRLLENGGNGEDGDVGKSDAVKGHSQSQDEVKRALKRAFYEGPDGDDSDDANMLIKKDKSQEEVEKEDREYREFLLQNLRSNPNAQQAMQEWISYSSSGNDVSGLSADDKFLIDYIMSRGWVLQQSAGAAHSVDDIVKAVEESEEELEDAESFEESFNFRFEHSRGATLVSHPRDTEQSMRRSDCKRSKERQAKQKRREAEKTRQEEELKRLKNLKREEMLKKAERLVQVSGTEQVRRLLESDSEEFDLEEHDKKMSQVFNEGYYGNTSDDGDGGGDDLNAGSDVSPEPVSRPIRKLLKRANSSSADADDIKRTIEEHLHKLDYEDKIDDIQCRFKYRSVHPSAYGLDTVDILGADDRALNRHVSLKKLAPYRSEEQQLADMRKYGDKRRVWMFRQGGK